MKWKNIAWGNTFFITATITEWQPLLLRQKAREILLADLDFYRGKYEAKIYAYVIMPEHYHLVLELARPEDLRGWLRDVQGHTGHQLSQLLQKTADSGELQRYARHANGKATMAIWKEQARAVAITDERMLRTKIEYVHKNPVNRKLVAEISEWQHSSWRNYYLDDNTVFSVDKVEML